ncbi:hypothetical protein C8R41DRAFT_810431 [Lentinula lateritia]|uniref:Secreted protein n=1 Tax=Lentinula lateritia TaxID=40482 RepID=A0ABQ8VZL0_9AGAR|nr:hypothetical protein C8R41DRAFT_810431 [Lentinula lateritia]
MHISSQKCVLYFKVLLFTQVHLHAPVHALHPFSSSLSFQSDIEVHLLHHQYSAFPPLCIILTVPSYCEALAQKACSGLTQTGPKQTQ